MEDAGAAPHAEAGPAGRTQRKIFFRHFQTYPHYPTLTWRYTGYITNDDLIHGVLKDYKKKKHCLRGNVLKFYF